MILQQRPILCAELIILMIAVGRDHRYRKINGRTAEPAGTPAQIANCILFLASDEASWVNGLIMACDGGATA